MIRLDQFLTTCIASLLNGLIKQKTSPEAKESFPVVIFIAHSPRHGLKTSFTSDAADTIGSANSKTIIQKLVLKPYLPGVYYLFFIYYYFLKYDNRITIVIPNYVYNIYRFPSLTIINILRSKLGIRILLIFQDSQPISYIEKRIIPVYKKIDGIIISDDPSLKIVQLYPVLKDIVIYYPFPTFPKKQLEKALEIRESIYDVTFFGNISGSQHFDPRKNALDFLAQNSIKVNGMTSDWQKNGTRLEYNEMMNVLANSKIGLNFSHHGKDGIVTSRAFEIIASGALLIQNPVASMHSIFKKGTEFIEFTSHEDLLTKIKFYCENEEERIRIARNASQRLMENYTAEDFLNLISNMFVKP